MDNTDTRERIVAYNNLRICLGHIDDGTNQIVSIYQDDKTKDFIMHVGLKKIFVGKSLIEVLAKAAQTIA